MRDLSLFIATIGAILVSICSSNSLGLEETTKDEPLKMASESLVVKSYKNSESTTPPPAKNEERFHRYQIYQGVMGRPGIDFPAYSAIPATGFSCRSVKKSGYYADLDTDCQVFHICDRNRKISFLCPNGTIFRQSHLICDWWFRVDCGKSVELYDESAEQLEADQKFYKARAEERQRRRKLVRTSTQSSVSGEEVSSLESTNSEESFNQDKSQSVHHRSNSFTTSTKQPPLRFDARKSQRNSKKVGSFVRVGSIRNYKDKQTESEAEINQGSKDFKQFTVVPSNSGEQKSEILFISNQQSSGNQEFETEGSKESIYEAESGSLVEDLSHRNKNFAFSGDAESRNAEVSNRQRNNNQFEQSSKKIVLKKLIINGVGKSTEAAFNEKSTEQSLESGNKAQSTISGIGVNDNLKQNFNNEETTTIYYENKKKEEAFTTDSKEGVQRNSHSSTDFNTQNQNINSAFGNFQNKIQGSGVANTFSNVRTTVQNLKTNYRNDQSEFVQSTYSSDQKYDFSSSGSIDSSSNIGSTESFHSNGKNGNIKYIASNGNTGSISNIASTERIIGTLSGGNIVSYDGFNSSNTRGSNSDASGRIVNFSSTDYIDSGKSIDNIKTFDGFGTTATSGNIASASATDGIGSRGNIATSSSSDFIDSSKSIDSIKSLHGFGTTISIDNTDRTAKSGNTATFSGVGNIDSIQNFSVFGTTASNGNIESIGNTDSIENSGNIDTFRSVGNINSGKNSENFRTFNSIGTTATSENIGGFGSTDSTTNSGSISSFSNIGSTSNSENIDTIDLTEGTGSRGNTATFSSIDSIGTTTSSGNIANIGTIGSIESTGNTAIFSGIGSSDTIIKINNFGTNSNNGNIGSPSNTGSTGSTGNRGNIATFNSVDSIGTTASSGNIGSAGYTGSTGSTRNRGNIATFNSVDSIGTTASSGNIGFVGNTGNTGNRGNIATLSGGNFGRIDANGSSGSSAIIATISSFDSTGNSEGLGNIGATGSSGSSSSVGIIYSRGSIGTSGKQTHFSTTASASEDSQNRNINFSYGTTAVPSNALKEVDAEVSTDAQFRYNVNKNFEYVTTQRPLHQVVNNFEEKSATSGSKGYKIAGQNFEIHTLSNNNIATISDESAFQSPTPSTVVKNFDADYVSSFEVVHPTSQIKTQSNVNIAQSVPRSFQNKKQTYVSLNNNLASGINSKGVQQSVLNNANTDYSFTTTENNFDFLNEEKTTTEKYNSFEYSTNNNLGQTEINSQVTSTAFSGDERKKDGTQTSGFDTTQYTTEAFNSETTRTSSGERQQTDLLTTDPRQNQFYDNVTPNAEDEKQLLVETAAFGSNRDGKSYFGYQSQWNALANHNQLDTTTQKVYRTTYESSKPTESFFTTDSESFTEEQFSTVTELYKTTPRPSSKINNDRLTFAPATETETFRSEAWPTTTSKPYFETTTGKAFNTKNVYFTTSIPEDNTPFTESIRIEGTSQRSEPATTKFNINLSLHELNINKDALEESSSIQSNLNGNREGLEVPPSAGPNAISSFALYYDTRNNTAEKQTADYLSVTSAPESGTTVSSFELRGKEVVKQVDDLVHRSSFNVTEHKEISLADEKLPNSLTVQTQDSYLHLFSAVTEKTEAETETKSSTEKSNTGHTEFDFGSTTFGAFTEEPTVINDELGKNDLDGSQSRGLVEPEVHENPDGTKVAPDLRKLAQVFTKALSAYLDDPEAFRKVLSEIRPTEPTLETESGTYNGNEFPSATKEDYEVLDFSDVSKPTQKKKQLATTLKEITTESFTAVFKTNVNESENLIVPAGSNQSWAANTELTAPLLESLDESQSSYYTPPTFTGTTNPVAEAINGFIAYTKPAGESNEEADSYFPETTTRGSTPKYGGFLNNTKETTKYSPYGSELPFEAFPPIGSNTLGASLPNVAETAGSVVTENTFTTTSEENSTSFYSHFSPNQTKEEEIQLAKELNNLVLLQKFTTPRGTTQDSSAVTQNISPSHLSTINDVSQNLDVKVDNEQVVEINHGSRTGKNAYFSEENVKSEYVESVHKEINPELESPSTPKGFLITYSLPNTDAVTYPPKTTSSDIISTTYVPEKTTTFEFAPETTTTPATQKDSIFYETTTFEYRTAASDATTQPFTTAAQSLERIAELQESLMFPDNATVHPKDEARETVEEIMDNLNVTPSTTHTLMKMMEMAAKNETYRRLVLLLVNDKSGKNKTAEEARLSLLRALLTPVINSQTTRSVVPIPDASKLSLDSIRSGREIESENSRKTGIEIQLESESSVGSGNIRRSKSIGSEYVRNPTAVTFAESPTKGINNNRTLRRMKVRKIVTRGNGSRTELSKRTVDNSKNKQIKINSLDQDAIVDSDSRAVELLRSLYSLAARWG